MRKSFLAALQSRRVGREGCDSRVVLRVLVVLANRADAHGDILYDLEGEELNYVSIECSVWEKKRTNQGYAEEEWQKSTER